MAGYPGNRLRVLRSPGNRMVVDKRERHAAFESFDGGRRGVSGPAPLVPQDGREGSPLFYPSGTAAYTRDGGLAV